MDRIDKKFLHVQFLIKVYQKNGTEFQSFFEDIMQKAFSDFQKIKPYGKKGDGGNDGYRPTEGIYYQIYAPKNPNEKEASAAQKLKEDFEKLKADWDQISRIKEYFFVFNDKEDGVSINIEKALAELKNNNPNIKFQKFTPKDLEGIFFALNIDEISDLGFDVDSRNVLSITRDCLEKLEVNLDKGNVGFVKKTLNKIFKDIVLTLQDEDLSLTYEILEARTLQKLERREEAKEKYESLCKRYPNDPQAILYLAEIYLDKEDFEKNEELLIKAEKIDSSYWLLELEKLIRDFRLSRQIDVEEIDEQTFPNDPRIKSNFYRLYSLFLVRERDHSRAESFIERAIYLNPENIYNYDTKLSILEGRVLSQNADKEKLQKDKKSFLTEIEKIEQIIANWGELGPRNQAFINFRKINALQVEENRSEIGTLAKESLELLLQCFFDQMIDKLLVEILMFVELYPEDFEILLQYLQNADKPISDNLAKGIVFQFNLKGNLLTDGKKFIEATKKKSILDFIGNIENKKYDEVWMFLKEDPKFAITMAKSAKEFPDLRKKIIENLPNDGSTQKVKLWFQLYYDEENFDEAFDLLKGFDLSNLSYFECKISLEIANKVKAWDFVVIILEKLWEYEKDKHDVLHLKLQLFTANLNLEKFLEVIQIGEQILSNIDEMELLNDHDKEVLLEQTVWARLRRNEYQDAKILLENYLNLSTSFEFKTGVEAEVYLRNRDAHKALTSVVEGIKFLKIPTPEQYGSLFMFFTKMDNFIDLSLTSTKKVKTNCFVKFEGQERWYFIGDEDELDVTKISSSDEKFTKFLGKKIREKIPFDHKYSSDMTEYTIESILPIEKYILWQCRHHAQKLTHEHRWDVVRPIEVPVTGGTVDTKYLEAFLGDERKKRDDFFDLYCRGNFPLAFLAINEGGLTNAIGLITNENKGFIKFSSGSLDEINQQKVVAKRIIEGEPFYIDGTSAFILSEIGLLEKINEHLPNLKVPQSVITFLLEIAEIIRYIPGQSGHMGYVQGKLKISSVDEEKRAAIQSNFENCRKILESIPKNIEAISSANKSDCFSEQKVPSELCDACILAQRDESIVLTEDFLYLQTNELETKKKAPEYCSSFALIKVLYEQKKITFDQHLDFFTYLSFYRFRFLPLTPEDLEKAVIGDGDIKIVQPERIRQFNFPLTLSEEYGVPFDKAFSVVGRFLLGVLVDDSILPKMAERIFAEILSAFPIDKDKKYLGKLFVRVCVQAINTDRQEIIIGIRVQEKIDLLWQFTEIYGSKINFR